MTLDIIVTIGGIMGPLVLFGIAIVVLNSGNAHPRRGKRRR